MQTAGHFHVEPRLIDVLGMQYKSTEHAIKELVVNAWDADATEVEISIPDQLLVTQPLVIRDNGYGMTRRQIEQEYLHIGYDRRAKGGTETPRGRTVRGFRGVGKFAGLMAAHTMVVQTTARGISTKLVLNRTQIEQSWDDLQKAEISVQSEPSSAESGTIVELHDLKSHLSLPSRRKLGGLLLEEFGRKDDFVITISGEVLTPQVLDVKDSAIELDVPALGPVAGKMWLSENSRPLPSWGFIIRVCGRAIGSPTFFGLESDPEVPKSLLHRVAGEIHADFLQEDVVASQDAFVGNSSGHEALIEALRVWLKTQLIGRRDEEAGRAPINFVDSYEDEIEKLPVPRRELARRALMRVFKRFYDEPEEKKRAIAELVLEAFEVDEYWLLVQRIEETPREDVLRLAEILQQWGLSDVADVIQRARARLKAVDAFESLIRDPATLELSGVHRALEQNAWLISDEYELAKSNKTLRSVVNDVLGQRYQGDRGRDRPDLFMIGLPARYLLVELKKPAHPVGRDDVAQAETYRDELRPSLPNADIFIAVIGGRVEPNLRANEYFYRRVVVTTFREVALGARQRLEWLIQNLDVEVDGAK